MYESIIRPLLFKSDPEKAHDLAMKVISAGLISAPTFEDGRLEQELFGVRFRNPIGLAAGFDKNAVAVPCWPGLGFGFTEVGTVTYHAQPGNPQPRLFRHPECEALVNRMGFNNEGARAVAERLDLAGRSTPLGINLGKSKRTRLEDAANDYANSFALLKDHGDYFVINVSSPNTPGLRQLQDKSALKEIIQAVGTSRPLFVKIAPDLSEPAILEVLEVALEETVTGIIATNTTLDHSFEQGGLSGAPVRTKSTEVLRILSKSAPPNLILIGVGGIFNADHVWEKMAAGAHLCQMYTGWIYGGPGVVPKILEALCERMDREGVKSLAEIRQSSR
ncbi:MAG: quinone-dependent dihydroorotate dehydrogenase [Fimbriimonadaceae bacterium]